MHASLDYESSKKFSFTKTLMNDHIQYCMGKYSSIIIRKNIEQSTPPGTPVDTLYFVKRVATRDCCFLLLVVLNCTTLRGKQRPYRLLLELKAAIKVLRVTGRSHECIQTFFAEAMQRSKLRRNQEHFRFSVSNSKARKTHLQNQFSSSRLSEEIFFSRKAIK